jgi:hypothetical protein
MFGSVGEIGTIRRLCSQSENDGNQLRQSRLPGDRRPAIQRMTLKVEEEKTG